MIIARSRSNRRTLLLSASLTAALCAGTAQAADFGAGDAMLRISEWMDREVEDRDGNDVGDLADLAVDPSTGRIAYAVIELERRGSGHIAVPLAALRPSSEEDDELILDASEQQWRSAERFEPGDWPSGPTLVAGSERDPAGPRAADIRTPRVVEDPRGNPAAHLPGDPFSARDSEFAELDLDRDGYLTASEWDSDAQLHRDEMDTDGDGRISRSEFSAFELDDQDPAAQDPLSEEGYLQDDGFGVTELEPR